MQAKTQIFYAIYALMTCAYAERIHNDWKDLREELESFQQYEEANRIDHPADRVSISYDPRPPAGDIWTRLLPELYGEGTVDSGDESGSETEST